MANILDRYGIKEVADVTFYEIDSTGAPSVPVLYLDTLKVSTIEQTAESADAKGGKGNAALISWDYGKEINVTLEDALFSAKSLAIMFGDGSLAENSTILKSEVITIATDSDVTISASTDAAGVAQALASKGYSATYTSAGISFAKTPVGFYGANGSKISGAAESVVLKNGDKIFCSFNITVAGQEVVVGANTFPGTYYVTGDTFARSQITGKDEFFQFIIPKAKVQSQNTITLQAEGDPSTFNMSLKVLRPDNGEMMKLVKYGLPTYTFSPSSLSMATTLTAGKTVTVAKTEGTLGSLSVTASDAKITATVAGSVITVKPGSSPAAGNYSVTVKENSVTIGTIAVTLTE